MKHLKKEEKENLDVKQRILDAAGYLKVMVPVLSFFIQQRVMVLILSFLFKKVSSIL